MTKGNLIYALALFIALTLVLSLGTGVVLLLAGPGGGQQQVLLWGLTRATWRDLHIWVSVLMAAGAIVHFALHWSWVVRMTQRFVQTALGRRKPLRSGRVKLFYALDSIIALSFLLSMLTGMSFWLLGWGGYQGGRNPAFRTALWGLSRGTWSDLHTWFSFVMAAAIAVHLALHWGWLVSKTKQLVRPAEMATQPVWR